jgi:hypothetical protein
MAWALERQRMNLGTRSATPREVEVGRQQGSSGLAKLLNLTYPRDGFEASGKNLALPEEIS